MSKNKVRLLRTAVRQLKKDLIAARPGAVRVVYRWLNGMIFGPGIKDGVPGPSEGVNEMFKSRYGTDIRPSNRPLTAEEVDIWINKKPMSPALQQRVEEVIQDIVTTLPNPMAELMKIEDQITDAVDDLKKKGFSEREIELMVKAPIRKPTFIYHEEKSEPTPEETPEEADSENHLVRLMGGDTKPFNIDEG